MLDAEHARYQHSTRQRTTTRNEHTVSQHYNPSSDAERAQYAQNVHDASIERVIAKLDERPRKWTASVSVAGQDVSDLLDLKHDTLRDTTNAAVALAAQLIRDEWGSDASVVLFKQLRDDDEPKRDRSVYVYRDDDGSVRTQRSGA